MCTMSMIYDHFFDKWRDRQPAQPIYVPNPFGPSPFPTIPVPGLPPITPEEIAEFRKLLDSAREYDRKHNQPDCETEEKRRKVKELAEKLGVDISFV